MILQYNDKDKWQTFFRCRLGTHIYLTTTLEQIPKKLFVHVLTANNFFQFQPINYFRRVVLLENIGLIFLLFYDVKFQTLIFKKLPWHNWSHTILIDKNFWFVIEFSDLSILIKNCNEMTFVAWKGDDDFLSERLIFRWRCSTNRCW